MSPAPDITVCIPAYQAAGFIEETLRSVQAQTHGGLVINVSVDQSTDDTLAICRRLAAQDERIRVFAQERRLGWIGNVNFLFDQVATALFFIMPHDDTIAPDYARALRDALQAQPGAVMAFAGRSEIDEGAPAGGWQQLAGPSGGRLLALLSAPNPGLPWQALTRADVLRNGRRMRADDDGFESHVLWVLELLCLGPFAFVPQLLYRKGPPRRGVVASWAAWPQERKTAAAIGFGQRCLELLAGVPDLGGSRHALVLSVILRALRASRQTRGVARVEPASRQDDLVLLAGLLSRALGFGTLDEAAVAALQREPLPRQQAAALLRWDAHRLKALGIPGAGEAAAREADRLDPAGTPATETLLPDDGQARRERRDAALALAGRTATDTPAGLLEAARLLLKARHIEAAEASVRQALALDDTVSEAHYLLAMLLQRGDLPQALAAARRALDLDPDSGVTQALFARLDRRARKAARRQEADGRKSETAAKRKEPKQKIAKGGKPPRTKLAKVKRPKAEKERR